VHNNLGLIVEADAHRSLVTVVAFIMLWKYGWNRRKDKFCIICYPYSC